MVAENAAPAVAHNLPLPLLPLLGRERELAEALARLDTPACRLLTLTGVGGVGKTRLALAIAEAALSRYRHGVWIVSLAPLQDAPLLAGAVARTLGVRETPGETIDSQLAAHLGDHQLLLVLDNCEHLRDACALLVDALLQRCSGLSVLATSRAPLRLRDEQRLAVPPLGLPLVGAVGPEAVRSAPAVAMFVACARAVDTEFELDIDNAQVVAAICRQLDGLPLAIELAAARVRARTLPELLAELGERLRALSGGGRHRDARQHTIHALLDWSYTLLGPGEQALFTRLSVFVGGWTLEAVQHVCVVDDDLPFSAAEGLAALTDQSLLQPKDAAGRQRMLELVREYAGYALTRLAPADDRARVRRSHAAFYLALAEESGAGLLGPDQAASAARLEAEHDNLRAVFRWALERDDDHTDTPRGHPERYELAMRIAVKIWRFWLVRGHVSEGRFWLDRLVDLDLAALGDVGVLGLRAQVLSAAAVLTTEQGEHRRAGELAAESLSLHRAAGDHAHAAAALNILATTAMRRGEYARATALYQESLAAFRELDDRRSVATVLNNMGLAARGEGDSARATVLIQESMALKQTLDDVHGIAAALNNLGEIALDQTDVPRARALFERGLALFREQQGQYGIALALTNLGTVARLEGKSREAEKLYRQSLMLYREMGNRVDVGECLEGLAALLCAAGQTERAARLVGAAAAHRGGMHVPLPPRSQADREHTTTAIRRQLGDEAFSLEWTAGRALSLEVAIDQALSWEQLSQLSE